MNLDLHQEFSKLDREDMYTHIQGLPDQLDLAWRLGQHYTVPEPGSIKQVIIAGMGGSAIGADLLKAYLLPHSSISIYVHRGYGLPAWVRNEGTLLIASSHSGNTEETLSAYHEAKRLGVQRLAICTGGKLSDLAKEDQAPVWIFEHKGQPRAAVGFSFGLLLALFARLGAVRNSEKALRTAVRAMQHQQADLEVEKPLTENPAKQFALRIADKLPVFFGAEYMAPIALRWKGQINELAKYWAQYEELPEADHNTLAGTKHPRSILSGMKMIMLQSAANHPRNQLRVELTKNAMEKSDLDVEIFQAKGEDPLTQIWTTLHFGDYAAYYLAMIKNVDPTPIKIMSNLKKEMSGYPQKQEGG